MREIVEISLRVNGAAVTRRVAARQNLVDFLREELGLTGTRAGCEHGVCGACTVRIDGVIARSCLMFVAQLDGARIETIEGLVRQRRDRRSAGRLSRSQRAAMRLLYGRECWSRPPELLRRAEVPSRDEIRDFLSGNYCRCTGYHAIIDAVETTCRARAGKVAP